MNQNKTYYFLAGFPRTGNTLLSALLNQNPDIYSSPLSPISSYLWEFEKINNQTEVSEFVKIDHALHLGNQIIKQYYQNINKPIIIDREKSWATPTNIGLIKKYITSTPKIIWTYRPILEILASIIKILPEHSYVDRGMENDGWFYKTYLSKNDNRCDYLMRPYGQIDRSLLGHNEVLNKKNSQMFYLINYNDLVTNPNKILTELYKFLELPNYKHDFNNIKNNEKSNFVIDEKPKGWHDIRPQLKTISQDPKEVLSEYVINKYSNMGYTQQ
jgi:sulfotransferase